MSNKNKRPLAIREQNGAKGEARTEAKLLDEFWVLKRSVDVEGADFLVQIPSDSLEELADRRNKIQAFGVIQAKFFEKRNQVRIKKDYIINDEGQVSSEFFAMLHTDNSDGEEQCYFFSAQDILDEFYLDESKEHYCFSLTNERDYNAFKGIKKKTLLKTIKSAIVESEYSRNTSYVNKLYRIFEIPTQHNSRTANFEYKLTFIEDHPIVLCINQSPWEKHLLEYRRDLFKNLGHFTWGYEGTGSYFLATCLLAHHFNGSPGTIEQVKNLQVNLLAKLDQYSKHTISTAQIVSSI